MDTNTSLKNKAALVTDGTSGIGEAVAPALAGKGAKVVVAGRREDEGQAVVDAIKKAGGEALFAKIDVSREADVKGLVDRTVVAFGRLDFAFNNAGIEGAAGLTVDSLGDGDCALGELPMSLKMRSLILNELRISGSRAVSSFKMKQGALREIGQTKAEAQRRRKVRTSSRCQSRCFLVELVPACQASSRIKKNTVRMRWKLRLSHPRRWVA